MVHKWNVAIQQELPWQSALEIAYVGNHQAHQLFQPDPNACPNFGTTDSDHQLQLAAARSSASGRHLGHGFVRLRQLRRRDGASSRSATRKGLTFLASYTYGHALANTGTTLSGSTGFGTPDPRLRAAATRRAAWDIRHNFVSSFTYEIPFGKGKQLGANMNRVVEHRRRQLAGKRNSHAAHRPTVHHCAPTSASASGRVATSMSFPGQNPQAAPSSGRSPDLWFNIAAVTAPAAADQGNLGLQSQTAPPTRVLDFSIFKDFPITERFRLQFRGEATNIANTPQYGTPDNNLQDANFGKVTGTGSGSERHIQFQLRLQF